jgi:hypothetical protein
VAALLANMWVSRVTKFVAFFLTGASSMLAEAIHSVADSGNQVLLLLWWAHRSSGLPTAQHPFGFGRDRYVYAFIVSIVLFSVGGLFALYEAYHKLQHVLEHPGDLGAMDWAGGGGCHWLVLVARNPDGGLQLPHGHPGVEQGAWAQSSWVDFVRRAKSPELAGRLCWRTLAALTGSGLRPVRGRAEPADQIIPSSM